MQDISMDHKEQGVPDKTRADDPYHFDFDQNGFPVFTDKNIRLVWAMIENDSAYNSAKPNTVKNVFEKALNGKEGDEKKKKEKTEAIKQAVYLTDSINSTRIATLTAADMVKVKANGATEEPENVISGFIVTDPDDSEANSGDTEKEARLRFGAYMTAWEIIYNSIDLMPRIKEGDDQVVFEIAHYAEQYAADEMGINITKNNFSFASKFCHHACVNSLGEDKYCIFDNVVKEALPYYIWAYTDMELPSGKYNRCKNGYYAWKKYLADCHDDKSPHGYKRFRECYDLLLGGINVWREDKEQDGSQVSGIDAEGKLTYQHVDRLIWYYFKGRRLDEAKRKFEQLIEW